MRTSDENSEAVIFQGESLKVVACDDLLTVRIEENGADITAEVQELLVNNDMQGNWVEMELRRPGFDGPFCVPGYGRTFT
jgi:hypothetical protein